MNKFLCPTTDTSGNYRSSPTDSDPVRDLWQEWLLEHPLSSRQERAAALAMLYWVDRRTNSGS